MEKKITKNQCKRGKPDISVLIATYNRATILRRTLEDMGKVERAGMNVEFIIVDNNSSDHTKETIKSFNNRLPIKYLFEQKSGKNCALNKALNEISLGEIVIFTDDDVTPEENWFIEIVEATKRWPNHKVFGGKIIPKWPNQQPPEWAKADWIQTFGYALHNLNAPEQPYQQPLPAKIHPYGPNFWTRKTIFAEGYRYNESIGPRPTDRIMGSEATFLHRLIDDGYEIIWCPKVKVEHRIQAGELTPRRICIRAFRRGRGEVALSGIKRSERLQSSPALWVCQEYALLGVNVLRYFLARLRPNHVRRVHGCVGAAKAIGFHYESLRKRDTASSQQ